MKSVSVRWCCGGAYDSWEEIAGGVDGRRRIRSVGFDGRPLERRGSCDGDLSLTGRRSDEVGY